MQRCPLLRRAVSSCFPTAHPQRRTRPNLPSTMIPLRVRRTRFLWIYKQVSWCWGWCYEHSAHTHHYVEKCPLRARLHFIFPDIVPHHHTSSETSCTASRRPVTPSFHGLPRESVMVWRTAGEPTACMAHIYIYTSFV